MSGLLTDVYAAITAAVEPLSDADFERPSRAEAWNVRELLFHQMLDAQRALVALASPTHEEPDVDEATYWQDFHPDKGDGGAAHARFVQRAAAAYATSQGLVGQWRVTEEAAARAADSADPDSRLRTQGHVLTVRAFVSTLVVEATVHLLDLTVELPGTPPTPPHEALTETRRVLERLYGEPFAAAWDDTEAVLRGTGRLPTADDRLPLLG